MANQLYRAWLDEVVNWNSLASDYWTGKQREDHAMKGKQQGEQLRRELAGHLRIDVEQVGHEWGHNGRRCVDLLGVDLDQFRQAEAFLRKRGAVWSLRGAGHHATINASPLDVSGPLGTGCTRCGQPTKVIERTRGKERHVTRICQNRWCEWRGKRMPSVERLAAPDRHKPKRYTGPSNESVALARAEREGKVLRYDPASMRLSFNGAEMPTAQHGWPVQDESTKPNADQPTDDWQPRDGMRVQHSSTSETGTVIHHGYALVLDKYVPGVGDMRPVTPQLLRDEYRPAPDQPQAKPSLPERRAGQVWRYGTTEELVMVFNI